MNLENTLCNQQWLADNSERIKSMLPETWTHIQNLNPIQLGFGLKVLGIDWRTDKEFGVAMAGLKKVGLMEMEGVLVRRSR